MPAASVSLALVLALGLAVYCVGICRGTGAESVTPAPGAIEGTGVPEWQRGEELARQYCGACHLFPEPELLDKRTWVEGTLRKMAPYLGVAQIRFQGRPDGARLEASHLFPTSPVLSPADWYAIRSYYVHEAPEKALEPAVREPVLPELPLFSVERLERAGERPPLTTLARVDVRRREIQLGDAGTAGLAVFDARGRWSRDVTLQGAAVSIVESGTNVFATLIGEVFPSDVPAGKLVRISGYPGSVGVSTVLGDLQRPVGTVVVDLNGDGREDLLVCGFGNYLGRLSWFEQRADGGYAEHVLLDVPGALRTAVCDANNDGKPDFIVLMAQGNEGLFLFTNRGQGEFDVRPLLRFHPAFGSTSFELVDMNADGFPDVVLTNGDNGEYPSPFKRYHGVRVYLNDGHYNFTEAWFHPLNGAFKALARDFDGDGDVDLAVISFFADYSRADETGFLYLQREAGMKFTARTLPEGRLGRWLTLDAGDVDGNGTVDLVLGNFSQGPPGIEIPKVLQQSWRTNGVRGLLLRNGGAGVKRP